MYTIRPYPVLGACLLVLAAFNPGRNEWDQVLVLFFTTFFGSAYCFLLNDIFDREKDRLNNKKRPLATGDLPLQTAWIATVTFALIFIFSSWFLGRVPFYLSFLFLIITSLYSKINVKTGLVANAIVAFVVAGTQWGVAIIKPDEILWASSLFLFFFTIPREILLDWLDMKGDKEYGKRSAPINFSPRKLNSTIILSLFLSSLCIAAAIILYLPAGLAVILAILILMSSWLSFLPFFRKPDHTNALASVRWTHVTFVILIFSLVSR